MQDGTDLQRHDINLRRFPQALSNDGTGAVFYFRPYVGDENENKWVIQLKGGGGCQTAALCAERWKSVDTPFGWDQMSTATAPLTGINGAGILYRGSEYDNPFANWNQVFIWYSSSDLWTGTGRNVPVRTVYPNVVGDTRSGTIVEFTMNFLGNQILEATINTLSGRRVPLGLEYRLDGGSTRMPDLDLATEVVLAGGSAGGYGVIQNLDRIAERLTRYNLSCRRRPCSPTIWGIADSAVGPSYESLDFTGSLGCPTNPAQCTYRQYVENDARRGAIPLWRPVLDSSCAGWHRANDSATTWQCLDYFGHGMEHVTTPIFVRMGQSDEVIFRGYSGLRLSVPGSGLITIPEFAELVRQRLLTFRFARNPILPTLEEGRSMARAPGVFSPSCSDHETLSNSNVVFGTTITVLGVPYTLFDVIENWKNGTGPTNVVTLPGGAESCS